MSSPSPVARPRRSRGPSFVKSLFKRNSRIIECPTNPEDYRKHIIESLSLSVSEDVVDLTPHVSKGDFINSGGYGEVYKGSWIDSWLKDSLPPVAIKVMRVARIDDKEGQAKRIKQLRRELRVWQGLEHKNILPLIATACLDGNPNLPAIISPWMENGDVMHYISRNPKIDREKLILDVIEAVDYLHSSKPQVVHGDMKAANILVDHRGNLYVADFGLSRVLEDATLWNTTATHATGTIRWTAPEILKGELLKVTSASDMYAFAMTCFEILSGDLPFRSLRNDGAVMTAVVIRNERPERSFVPTASDQVWELITKCWSTDSDQRLDSKEVITALKQSAGIFPPGFIEIKSMNTGATSTAHVVCSPVDSQFAINRDGVISIGDYLSGNIERMSTGIHICLCMHYSPDGTMLAIADHQGVQIRTISNWKSVFGILTSSTTSQWISMAYSPNGKWMACGNKHGQIRIWDTLSGRVVHTFQDHLIRGVASSTVSVLAISHCSRKLASTLQADNEAEVGLWDVESCEMLYCFRRPDLSSPCHCRAIAFSPISNLLAIGYSDGAISLCNTAGKNVVRTAYPHNAWVNSIAFSHDGKMVASGSVDKTICLMSTATGKNIGTELVGHRSAVTSVSFSPDASKIVSGSSDHTIRVWEARW